MLFEVFSQRYERGSNIVTSNLPFDDWTEVFGSEHLIPTRSGLDRLTHHVQILEMNCESYRLRMTRKPGGGPVLDRDEVRRRRFRHDLVGTERVRLFLVDLDAVRREVGNVEPAFVVVSVVRG